MLATRPILRLYLLIAAAILLSFLIQYRNAADFFLFAFYDPGAALHADTLLSRGLLPTIDFGYSYGLLPLALTHPFFALLGPTPSAYLVFTLLAELAIAFNLARLLHFLQIRWPGLLLFLLAIPYAIQPVYLNLTHPIEAFLLTAALASQAQGQRARTLALLTLAAFVKPSMAYLFGALTLALLIHDTITTRAGLKSFLKKLLPAALTGLLTAALLAACFGLHPLINTLLPLTGSRSYKLAGFGFFTGKAQIFWLNPAGLPYYLFTEAGFWLLATLFLLTITALSLPKLLCHFRLHPHLQLLLTLTTLHTLFICLFFGYPGSWQYYSYLLILGLVLALHTLPQKHTRYLTPIFALIALLGLATRATLSAASLTKTKSPETANLYAWDTERADWLPIRALAQREHLFFLIHGNLQSLSEIPLTQPDSWFLSPGIPLPNELNKINTQIQKADATISFNQYAPLQPYDWPELSQSTSNLATLPPTPYFTIHEHPRP